MAVVLYILFFGYYSFSNYKKFGLNASTFVLVIYLVSTISAYILLFHYDTYEIEYVTPTTAIFHCCTLFLFLSPIISFWNQRADSISLPRPRGLHVFTSFIVVLCLMSIVYSLSKLEVAFSYSDLSEVRKLHNERELFEEEQTTNIFSYVASFGHHFSIFAIFLFFLYSIHFPQKKKILIVLLISSLAVVLNNLSIMGRDGIVRWTLFFLFWFLFFKNELSKKLVRKVLLWGSVILIPIVFVFMLITISRFSGRSEGIIFYILDYIGEPFVMFSYNFQKFFDGVFNGRLNFPIFFDSSERVPINNLNETIYAAHNLNTFPTFVGSFYLDFGFLGTFILALAFKISTWFYMNFTSKKFTFSRIILFSIFVQIALLGVFYYMFSSPTVIKAMILIFLISLLIQIKYSKIKYRIRF